MLANWNKFIQSGHTVYPFLTHIFLLSATKRFSRKLNRNERLCTITINGVLKTSDIWVSHHSLWPSIVLKRYHNYQYFFSQVVPFNTDERFDDRTSMPCCVAVDRNDNIIVGDHKTKSHLHSATQRRREWWHCNWTSFTWTFDLLSLLLILQKTTY